MCEQKYLKYCKECSKTDDIPGAKYHIPGYKSFYDSDNFTQCLECGCELIQFSMLCEEYHILTHISNDPNFIEQMISLKETDIVEFNLKMSQFRTQLSQEKSVEMQNSSQPKCPICNGTSLSKISAVKKVTKVGLFGIFGAGDLGKTWKCNSCGSRF